MPDNRYWRVGDMVGKAFCDRLRLQVGAGN